MEQFAIAYRVRESLIVGSVARTSMGVGLEVKPLSLAMTSPDEEVAAAIEKALIESRNVIPHPSQDQWSGIFKPFERAAGVQSYKAFMAIATSVAVERSTEQLILTPQRNLGSKEGFEPIASDAVALPARDLIAVAVALKAIFDRNGS